MTPGPYLLIAGGLLGAMLLMELLAWLCAMRDR
jgi:hypothetical protein